jgi:hypothetical protein
VIGPTYLWTATRDGADVHRVSMLISRDVRAVEAESRARWNVRARKSGRDDGRPPREGDHSERPTVDAAPDVNADREVKHTSTRLRKLPGRLSRPGLPFSTRSLTRGSCTRLHPSRCVPDGRLQGRSRCRSGGRAARSTVRTLLGFGLGLGPADLSGGVVFSASGPGRTAGVEHAVPEDTRPGAVARRFDARGSDAVAV